MKTFIRIGFVTLFFVPAFLTAQNSTRVLVFTKTEGFRHNNITEGVNLIDSLGRTNGFEITATEDASTFTVEDLQEFSAIIFFNTSGDVLDENQEEAFQNYIRSGGGYVGVHAAADTEQSWPWYEGLVGARFIGHTNVIEGQVRKSDLVHPSTEDLPISWEQTDEWYRFNRNPRGKVHTLVTVDPRRNIFLVPEIDYPISWCHDFEGGRSWYTGMGHGIEALSNPFFVEHLLGGIQYATGIVPGNFDATLDVYFTKELIDNTTSNPTSLDISEGGTVFYTERDGTIKIFDPELEEIFVAGVLDVDTNNEDGLLGITLDPDFESNRFIYLYYSPEGGQSLNRVSRFTVNGRTLDLSSETIVIEIPVQREECCHAGGGLDFGPDGSLYIATGDNTNPFQSDGYSPLDEAPGREFFDAQATSGNTNDLRGKILRVIPLENGGYTIPEGNLFSQSSINGLEEIFVMGVRNPFKISVDQENGWLYWGDVGPDAINDDSDRGPRGYDEINRAEEAGNFGWPFFSADNLPYTSPSGGFFDVNSTQNQSPNNTGSTLVPPSEEAFIWYPDFFSVEFPELSGNESRTALLGPVFHFDSTNTSQNQLPPYFDNTLFMLEWSRMKLYEIKMDSEGNLNALVPFLSNFDFIRPIDMKISNDGHIYLLEWGSNFFGPNPDSKLSRITYEKITQTFELINTPDFSAEVFPNPANTNLSINLELKKSLNMEMELYDLEGNFIQRSEFSDLKEGSSRLDFNVSDITDGIFILKMKAGTSVVNKRILIVR